MGELVDLRQYREKTVERRAYGLWRERFNEPFGYNTRLRDISNKTLFWLAGPGEKSARAFYELIVGVLGMGRGSDIESLEKINQLKVIDVHLFLVDQARFELMRRIAWLENYPCQDHSLIDMVLKCDSIKNASKRACPMLSETHPQFGAFQAASDFDKETLIRTLLPLAIDRFKSFLD